MVKFATGLLALIMLVGVVATVAADDKDKDSDNAKTITGCLQKGEGSNEFMLTGSDGSTWEIKSDNVDLASHVGQTVTVTGDRSKAHAKAHDMKEGAKSEAQEHGMDKGATEHGHLKVSNVTKVSDSCKQ